MECGSPAAAFRPTALLLDNSDQVRPQRCWKSLGKSSPLSAAGLPQSKEQGCRASKTVQPRSATVTPAGCRSAMARGVSQTLQDRPLDGASIATQRVEEFGVGRAAIGLQAVERVGQRGSLGNASGSHSLLVLSQRVAGLPVAGAEYDDGDVDEYVPLVGQFMASAGEVGFGHAREAAIPTGFDGQPFGGRHVGEHAAELGEVPVARSRIDAAHSFPSSAWERTSGSSASRSVGWRLRRRGLGKRSFRRPVPKRSLGTSAQGGVG